MRCVHGICSGSEYGLLVINVPLFNRSIGLVSNVLRRVLNIIIYSYMGTLNDYGPAIKIAPTGRPLLLQAHILSRSMEK